MTQSEFTASPNRLDVKLAARRPLLTCYFPVGDPKVPLAMLDIYHQCGVDILELGLPAANPFMDGQPVSQSMRRALDTPNILACLEVTARTVQSLPDGPAALCMSYSNIDIKTFLESGAWRHVDGLLMVGPESATEHAAILALAETYDMRLAKFVNWALDPALVAAARASTSYIMLQAADGVTGARPELNPENREHIERLRALGLAQPILLGFGIGSPPLARAATRMGADGVIIGSECLVRALQGPDALRDFLSAVREALDA